MGTASPQLKTALDHKQPGKSSMNRLYFICYTSTAILLYNSGISFSSQQLFQGYQGCFQETLGVSIYICPLQCLLITTSFHSIMLLADTRTRFAGVTSDVNELGFVRTQYGLLQICPQRLVMDQVKVEVYLKQSWDRLTHEICWQMSKACVFLLSLRLPGHVKLLSLG